MKKFQRSFRFEWLNLKLHAYLNFFHVSLSHKQHRIKQNISEANTKKKIFQM